MLQTEYRQILKNQLLERCKKNPKYSLRAFAKSLAIEPSQLSRVISGERHFSLSTIRQIAEKLFEDQTEKEKFLSLFEVATAKNPVHLEAALKDLTDSGNQSEAITFELESMKLISDWYHFAILDLTTLSNFKNDEHWIAYKLGISIFEVRDAIERLLKLGLLQKKDGNLKKTNLFIRTPSGVANESLKKHHRQMISKALTAIDQQPLDERFVRSKTMGIAKKDLPKYRELAEQFMENVNKLIKKTDKKDSVYQLNLQLYNLLGGKK